MIFDTSNGQRKTYYSGVLIAADVSPSSYLGTSPLLLGRNGVTGGFIKVILDDVRIYDRALSAAEVAALYQLENTPPTRAPTAIDLNGASVAENLPVGTVVGEFNATDPDANATHVFALVDGNGSQHNNLFTLDANGTLKTATILDHEANATRSIRVRATDEHNASLEKVFVVNVTDDTRQPQTITWDQNISGRSYGGLDIGLVATASSSLPVIFSSSDNSIAKILDDNVTLKIMGAGTATITASQVGNGLWEAVSVTKDMTITKSTAGAQKLTRRSICHILKKGTHQKRASKIGLS